MRRAGSIPTRYGSRSRRILPSEEIHHVHLWNIASDTPALSAHVLVANEERLHEAQLHADRVKAMLKDRFGIEHATLELECHRCGPETATVVIPDR